MAVLGGDGSVSIAARALIAVGGGTSLAILAAGTGNDLAKSLGAPVHDYGAMAWLIARRAARRIDAGMVDNVSFVNAAGFGFDAETIARLASSAPGASIQPPRWDGPSRSRYVRAALGALWSYRGFSASISADGADGPSAVDTRGAGAGAPPRTSRLMLVFANGRSFGGAFLIAPDADVGDGALDMVSIGDAVPGRRIALFARAMRGTHMSCAEVSSRQGASFVLQFDEPPLFEADGELHQARNATVNVRCIPAAVTVVAP